MAHPDDETLWSAGLILRYPKDWTVICCTIPYHDPIRAEKFHDACKTLGAMDSVAIDHSERAGLIPVPDLSDFDLIVTHNEVGEYGHVQHRELHNAVKGRWPEKMLCFGYGGGTPKLTLALSDIEAEKKLAALQCYDHRASNDRGKMKWEVLLETFSSRYDLWREPYL